MVTLVECPDQFQDYELMSWPDRRVYLIQINQDLDGIQVLIGCRLVVYTPSAKQPLDHRADKYPRQVGVPGIRFDFDHTAYRRLQASLPAPA